MSKIGIFGFGKVGKNFYDLLQDLGLSDVFVYDDYCYDILTNSNPEKLKECEIILICSAKKELQELFLDKLLNLGISKEKIRLYTDSFYASYWLENSIKNYFDNITQEAFVTKLLSDTLDLINLQKILKNALESIDKTDKDCQFYDDIYLISDIYTKDYKENIYYPGWKYALNIIKKHKNNNTSILDIGCGVGIFARMLHDNNIKSYLGIDFSAQALKIARENNPYWRESFIQEDIFISDKITKEYTCICIFEVLEHINNDLAVLQKIPSKSNIIASVPNFYSKGHIRVFENQDAICLRYGDLLDFIDFFELTLPTNNAKIFYFNAIKR